MWEGREASLESQAVDAALIHFQAPTAPTPAQVDQVVAFKSCLYSARVISAEAGPLNVLGAQGRPEPLSAQEFFVGINDPLGQSNRRTVQFGCNDHIRGVGQRVCGRA